MEKIISKIIHMCNPLGENEEIVRYGIEIAIMRLIFVVTVLLAGILMKSLLESIIFTISFSLLRQYCGGYHAYKRVNCLISSTATLIAALIITKIAYVHNQIILPIIIIAGVAVIYIFTSAPIDTASKRLDNDECREYGKRAKILAVLLIMLSVMLYIFNISNIACTVAIGIIFEGLLMICGYVQNIRNGETL